MPLDLVLVRHGESEGNIVHNALRHGDTSLLTPEFAARHSSHWRLSDRGRDQAIETGEWLRSEFPEGFDRLYVSEYDRAKETAGLLDIDGQWYIDYNLRERDWGDLDHVTAEDLGVREAANILRAAEPFYWKPSNGESLAQVSVRLSRVLDTLHRECDGKTVIIVCHGEVMWTLRVMLERMNQMSFRQLDASRHAYDTIHNCQVPHYTRRAEGGPTPYLNSFRSVCPWDHERAAGHFHPIERKRYNGSQLLEQVEHWPRVING